MPTPRMLTGLIAALVVSGAAVAAFPAMAQKADVGIEVVNEAPRPMTVMSQAGDEPAETVTLGSGESRSFQDVQPIAEGERSERRYRIEVRRDPADRKPHCGVDVLVQTAWGAGGSAVGCNAATVFRYCSLRVAGGGTGTAPEVGPPPCRIVLTVTDD